MLITRNVTSIVGELRGASKNLGRGRHQHDSRQKVHTEHSVQDFVALMMDNLVELVEQNHQQTFCIILHLRLHNKDLLLFGVNFLKRGPGWLCMVMLVHKNLSFHNFFQDHYKFHFVKF